LNILYIIGNGFDLNIGLKTSYQDFYEYYKSIKSPNDDVDNLKRQLIHQFRNWADLELALGVYTKELKSLQEFDNIYDDIIENLGHYLETQEKRFEPRERDREIFFENLVRPENHLQAAYQRKIRDRKNEFTKVHWHIDIFTLNYTTVIEKIVGQTGSVDIGHHLAKGLQVYLREIKHIHGKVDQSMVLGVNDLSQLKNIGFHDNQNVTEAIIKERYNKASRHTIDEQFKDSIKKADLICIFGTSIGDTDKIWWELVGQRLKSRIPLVLFTKGEEVSSRMGHRINRKEREMRDYFLGKTMLTTEERDKFGDEICVVFNSSMFQGLRRA